MWNLFLVEIDFYCLGSYLHVKGSNICNNILPGPFIDERDCSQSLFFGHEDKDRCANSAYASKVLFQIVNY